MGLFRGCYSPFFSNPLEPHSSAHEIRWFFIGSFVDEYSPESQCLGPKDIFSPTQSLRRCSLVRLFGTIRRNIIKCSHIGTGYIISDNNVWYHVSSHCTSLGFSSDKSRASIQVDNTPATWNNLFIRVYQTYTYILRNKAQVSTVILSACERCKFVPLHTYLRPCSICLRGLHFLAPLQVQNLQHCMCTP